MSRKAFIWAFFLLCSAFSTHSALLPAAEPTGGTAVLLLAHGGSSGWNREASRVRRALVKEGFPTELALGMADPASIEAAVKNLEVRRPSKIIALPLLIDSNSELYEQFRYVLGLRSRPSMDFIEGMQALAASQHEDMGHQAHVIKPSRQIKSSTPIILAAALDDHPSVAQVLFDRAKRISRNPANEAVLLISHGPYTDSLEELWMYDMQNVARRLAELGGFDQVRAFNLRDDSSAEVKGLRSKEIREFAQERVRAGKTILVLAHLISMSGVESHIIGALKGVPYRMSREALLPHRLIEEWAVSQVKSLE